MEKLAYGFEMMGIGLLIVFFALALLSVVIMLFNKILSSFNTKGGGGGGVQVKSDQPPAEMKIAPGQPVQGDRPEIIAAIMGAISLALDDGGGRRFAVTSITGTGAANADLQSSWVMAGRNRLMQKRQDFVLSKRGKVR